MHRPTCKVFTASMVSWPKGKGIWKMTSLTWGCEGSLPDIVRRQERGKWPLIRGASHGFLLPRGRVVVSPGLDTAALICLRASLSGHRPGQGGAASGGLG
ncbi:hypothetical protein KAM479_24470 [Aeromonas caviae]|nr:hypothetical protein KAM497c_34710 [Aeromonas caviae]GKR70526.1 hypothetical protein KAM479_24470 [Aeromonas caviae]